MRREEPRGSARNGRLLAPPIGTGLSAGVLPTVVDLWWVGDAVVLTGAAASDA